jgi:hypothetical protein
MNLRRYQAHDPGLCNEQELYENDIFFPRIFNLVRNADWFRNGSITTSQP